MRPWTRLDVVVLLVVAAALVFMLAVWAPAIANGASFAWQRATASGYSTTDSPGVEGCTGRPLSDRTRTFASLIVPCGARVEFCSRRRCVIATRTDSGPYVAGRSFDLALGTLRALGYSSPQSFGVRTVAWRRLP